MALDFRKSCSERRETIWKLYENKSTVVQKVIKWKSTKQLLKLKVAEYTTLKYCHVK